MRYRVLLPLFIVMQVVDAQEQGPHAMIRVDSLIQVSRDFTVKGEFERAMEANAIAENLALQTFGRTSDAYGRCVFNKGRVYDFKEEYSDAEKWYLESIAIRSQVLGSEHPDYANSLHNLAGVYYSIRQYDKAEKIYLEVIAIREKVLGKLHSDYGGSVYNLAKLYLVTGQYQKAESFYLDAFPAIETAYGKAHPFYDYILNDMAGLYKEMGQYQKAEEMFLESKTFRERVYGNEHPQYAACIFSLATLYSDIGQYEKAELYFLESNAIRRKTLGEDHPHYAASLNNLAILYAIMGFYEKAEPLYLESKNIREKTLGVAHPDYAASLNNLAILYWQKGKYDKAEALYLESIDRTEKNWGKVHISYAHGLNNLALLYLEIGNYEKAEPLFFESLDISEKVFGKSHPGYAASLNNLAALYMETGAYGKAEHYNLETLVIRENVLGRDHADYANSLNNLALVYFYMGQYDKAEPHFIEAKNIREKILGTDHPEYASSLTNLALLYLKTHNYTKAEPLYLEAEIIRRKTLGEAHPLYAWSLNSLAMLYEYQSRYSEAMPFAEAAMKLMNAKIINGVTFLSEQELAQYKAIYQQVNFRMFSYLLKRPEDKKEELSRLSFDQVLFEKGFLLQSALRLVSLVGSSHESVALINELKGYRRRIAAELSKPNADRQPIVEWEAKANDLEKQMARNIIGYAAAMQQVNYQEVQSQLNADAIALEFVHFSVNFPEQTDSVQYAVLLLRSGVDPPQIIPLFEEGELEHLLDLNKERKADYVNDLYARADRGIVKLGGQRKSLYDLIWKNIEAKGLDNVKSIYYSPSGLLHRLNLGAIAIDEETILSDRYNLVALNSTRQLVIPAVITTLTNDAMIIGGVQFEADTIHSMVDSLQWMASRSSSTAWAETGTRGENWTYLKWTEKEVERIAATLEVARFKTVQYTGKEASEEVIKTIGNEGNSPRILHIATHGFFFSDPTQSVLLNTEGEPVFKLSDNPMIRSGLILAGGNYAWQHGRAPQPEMEDGILTAYEISQMNLNNTELVVLSACETGLGDIQGNEGVYGLQRAFKIAGAKYLIMSLWQVPDRETMEFMTTFYKNWLEEKMTIPDAFRKTQREMRDRFFNPYSWAGFVLVE